MLIITAAQIVNLKKNLINTCFTLPFLLILNRGHPGYYLSEYLTDNSGSKVGRTSELKTKPTRELCCLVQLSTSNQLKDS